MGPKRAACFHVPMWHRMQWDERRAYSDSWGDVAKAGDSKVAGFSEAFAPEIFHRLYSDSPVVVPTAERDAAAAVRSKLHDLASELPEFGALASRTAHDPFAATIATEMLADHVARALPARHSPPPDADKLGETLRALESLAEQFPEGSLTSELTAALKASALATRATFDAACDIDESATRQALRRAVEAAHAAIKDAQDACAAFGMGEGPAGGGRVDPNAAAGIAKRVRNSASLQKIVELAGRLKATARAKRATKTEYARSELVGVEQTGDVSRILPSELGALGHPLRGLDLVRRLGERSAMGYSVRGREKAAKGPIVVGLDISWSMVGAKDTWAKAIALAILDIARTEGRPFRLVTYNGAPVDDVGADKPTDVSLPALLDALSREPFGGTDFDVPVRACLDIIEREGRAGKPMGKADVILVTDALCGIEGATSTMARADAMGAHVFGILVGSRERERLQAWAHDVTAIDDVTRDTAATDMIFGAL